MKNQFKGYYGPSEEVRKEIWKQGTFVFDANVLLNLYRYSEDTRDQFIRLLKNECLRCWLPEQCGAEYLSNRLAVISEQIKKYSEVNDNLNGLQASFDGQKGHPFLRAASLKKLKKTISDMKTELDESKQNIADWINDDPIKEAFAEIFEGRVGEPFSKEELDGIFDDGEDRYERKIPPGYKDASKSPNAKTIEDKKRKFGDLIFWKQIIKKSKADGQSIILVTDDNKEDWWLSANGRTVSPRPELLSEFFAATEREILIYNPFRFLELAKKNLNEKITETAIDEVKEEEQTREYFVNKWSQNVIEHSNNKTQLEFYGLESSRQNLIGVSGTKEGSAAGEYQENQRQVTVEQVGFLLREYWNALSLFHTFKSDPSILSANDVYTKIRELRSGRLSLELDTLGFGAPKNLIDEIRSLLRDIKKLEEDVRDFLSHIGMNIDE
ncbi:MULTISPECIES: PIN domain-containing protein [unclassified Pseudovibrio]|uniref:PIN domain-containing protein n=1 Tax=unclassified Pseudovibrio TaxID=2627060 RepID=UPI0007AE810A|nr:MULTISPECIES: PIN domain-containing protein [unclassified Pseudovibrio]KZK97295.1 hypothetical protein PsW74_03735 [Pseudovibrio sp. W74]KZL08981.1 hypothetical protein PsAD14_02560 [Pseudovibrio sp. Ad14]